MFVSHLRVLLRFNNLQIRQSKNLLQNVSNTPKLPRYLSGCAFQNEKSNNSVEENNIVEEQSLSKTGYSARLESNVFMKENINIENNTNLIKRDNLEKSNDIQFVEDYKCSDVLEDINEKLPGPLDPCTEDLSDIGPNLEPTYNFAKYADQSYTIQQFVKLGVELYKLEKYPKIMKLYLSLDFDKNVVPYLRFLHNCGLDADHFGHFITRYPTIFEEDMDNLLTRIRYLRAHDFTPDMIKDIMYRYPSWLSVETQEIDRRLGYFQCTFELSGPQIRALSTKCPKLITYDMRHIKENTFSVKEEMGFLQKEIKQILLTAPRVWIIARSRVVQTFDYLHNTINFPHSIISDQSKALLCRRNRLENRHKFLVTLKRNQHDPKKPLYVSPLMLALGDDLSFCKNVAKSSLSTYNAFLKTL